jgi:hypothetical protein
LAAGAALLAACSSYTVVKHHEDEPEPPADTATAYEPAASTEEASAPPSDLAEYVTKPGDTLEGVARRHLGRGFLWRHLAEWNHLTQGPHDPLPAGRTIVVPLRFKGLGGGDAVTLEAAAELKAPPPPPGARPAGRDPARVYRPGEKLTFDVKWYAITAGEATMEVAPAGTDWQFIARARSTLVFFFKVDDRIESVSTRDRLLPLRFEKHLHEGSHRKDLSMTFDRAAAAATYYWTDKEGRHHAYPYPLGPDCRDLLGAFYWFRTMELPPVGREVNLCVHTDKTNYPLAVKVLGRETIRVPAGEFHTVLIKPRLNFEGLFRQRGDVLIWMTDDEARIPVLVQSKVFLLGSVNIVLTHLVRP